MGATRVVDVSAENLQDVQREIGMKEGFDVGLEMSGIPGAHDMIDNNVPWRAHRPAWDHAEKAAVDWNKGGLQHLTIRGIYGREMYETWYKMTAHPERARYHPGHHHRFPFTGQEAFRLMPFGQSGKVILDWEGGAPAEANSPSDD